MIRGGVKPLIESRRPSGSRGSRASHDPERHIPASQGHAVSDRLLLSWENKRVRTLNLEICPLCLSSIAVQIVFSPTAGSI